MVEALTRIVVEGVWGDPQSVAMFSRVLLQPLCPDTGNGSYVEGPSLLLDSLTGQIDADTVLDMQQVLVVAARKGLAAIPRSNVVRYLTLRDPGASKGSGLITRVSGVSINLGTCRIINLSNDRVHMGLYLLPTSPQDACLNAEQILEAAQQTRQFLLQLGIDKVLNLVTF